MHSFPPSFLPPRVLGACRVIREGEVIYESKAGTATLRHFKDIVPEVRHGTECGVGVGFDDVQPGDILECFDTVSVKQSL